MQQRHKDRKLYFNELANTSREFYLDYISRWITYTPNTRVLEIGCGEGGNLLPFAEKGCHVTGIDINEPKIQAATTLFQEHNLASLFIASDFMQVPIPTTEEEKYDLVLIHDVIEHIEPPYKEQFVLHMKKFMRRDAIAFFAFPAWQMPFGGHQQICVHKISKIPFIHLLPTPLYRSLLKKVGEAPNTIDELMSIKRSKMPVEKFGKLIKECELKVVERKLWLINPHYKQKFGLRPMRVVPPFTHLAVLRNFYTTSVWYILHQ